MADWSVGTVLVGLLLAILVPALAVHFTLGRHGGHHLFKDLPKERVRDLPAEMLRFRLRHQLRGSLAALVGLGVVLLAYPLACKVGIPLNVLGLSDQQFVFVVALGVGLLVIVGFALFYGSRGG